MTALPRDLWLVSAGERAPPEFEMGRRPNPLILEYFERGPKLNDNSNRYPHTCKQCGENFPKGRIDSLTTHITKRCPAISDSERMRACLELHGITHARSAAERHHQAQVAQANGQQISPSALPQGWSALETLAEASRQVDLNENSRGQKTAAGVNQAGGTPGGVDKFELQEQYTLDNPPVSYENSRVQGNSKKGKGPGKPTAEHTPDFVTVQYLLTSIPTKAQRFKLLPRPERSCLPKRDSKLSYPLANRLPMRRTFPLQWQWQRLLA